MQQDNNTVTAVSPLARVIAESDKTRHRIAEHSEILFRLSFNDPSDKICSSLMIAAGSLRPGQAKDSAGIKKYVMLARMTEDMYRSEEQAEEIIDDLREPVGELYKLSALLETIRECAQRDSSALSALLSELKGIYKSESLTDTERQLADTLSTDINKSQLICAGNISSVNNRLARLSLLTKGIKELEDTIIPLWKGQLAEARLSLKAEDMTRCIQTGGVFGDRLYGIILKFSQMKK